jgi:hypothetical protein
MTGRERDEMRDEARRGEAGTYPTYVGCVYVSQGPPPLPFPPPRRLDPEHSVTQHRESEKI